MKFRRLTYEELEDRTSQFLQFLAQNAIDTSQWSDLQKTNPKYVQKLVDDFSDLVMEDNLNEIEFLEQRTDKELKVYKLLDSKAVVINLQINAGTELNLCRYASVSNLLSGFDARMWKSIQLNISEFVYESDRAQTIFQFMESGCFITKEIEFNTLYHLSQRAA
ncbi:MAG: DUF6495 family protein [Chitinophagales bacterium]